MKEALKTLLAKLLFLLLIAAGLAAYTALCMMALAAITIEHRLRGPRYVRKDYTVSEAREKARRYCAHD